MNPIESLPFFKAQLAAERPIRRIAVAVQEVDGGSFVFAGIDGDDPSLNWSGDVQAATSDAALLEVFVRIRSQVDSLDRIRFLVKLPKRSLVWVHQKDMQDALPRCTIQGPGPRDGELMVSAVEHLSFAAALSESRLVRQVTLPALTVAADGSVRGRSCGYAWLSSDGQYGLQSRTDSPKAIGRRASMVAELRAIDFAVLRLPSRHLTIYCDNSYAVSMGRKWMEGQLSFPDGYSIERSDGSLAGLVYAQSRLHRNASRLDIRWARSHQREPLNEGADALARLAFRYERGDSGLTQAEYQQRAQGLAKAFAQEFRRLVAV